MVDASVDPCALLESLQLDVDSFDRLADAVLESFTTRQRFIQFLDEYRHKVQQGQGDPVKLALGYLVLDRWAEVLDCLAKAPDGKFRRFYAAKAASALGRYDAALSELEQAAAKGWDRFSTDMLSAAIHVRKGEVAAAEKLAQKHAQAGRDRADWYYVQGLLREHADEWVAAVEQYEHALTLEPHHAPATFRCAWLYDIHGDDERAIELYQRLVLQPRAHVNALMNLAVIYEDIGEYDDALECIQRVLKAYPNHTRARLFLKDVESCWGMVVEEPGDTPVDSSTRLLDTAISEFELSVRARNCLKKMNIRTLGDLVRLNEVELLSFKNFGETSLSEIKALLAKRGLRLGQPTEEAAAPEPAAEPGAPAAPRVVVPPGRESVLSKPVSELELSVRARRCLQRLNVNTLNDLIQLTEADLLAARNFGVTSLNEVKARLTEHGLQLAPKRGE